MMTASRAGPVTFATAVALAGVMLGTAAARGAAQERAAPTPGLRVVPGARVPAPVLDDLVRRVRRAVMRTTRYVEL